MTPAFASWNEFFAMGGYAFFCLAGGGDDRYSAGGFGRALGDAHRAILRGVAQQRAREARLRATQQQEAA